MKRTSAILKTFIVSGILTFSLIASASAQEVSTSRRQHSPGHIPPPIPAPASACTPSPSGLVGWWPGEGNANDLVGTNNGSVVNGVVYVAGEAGQAFSFDGSTSLITVPASASLAVSNMTLEAWVYPKDTSARPIIDYGGAGQRSPIQFWINTLGGAGSTAGAMHVVVLDSNSDGWELDDVNPDVQLNQWNHVAFTVNAATGAFALYCNGSLVASNTAPSPFIPPSLVNVNIGYRDAGSAEILGGTRFYGYLDEVSIYNRALSAAEIKAIYDAGSAGKCPIACVPPPAGLVSWWPGEGNANDSIGTNNGTLSGVGFAAGEVGEAFSFDGSTSLITVPASASLAVSNMTLEAWVYPQDTTARPIIDYGGAGQRSPIQLWIKTLGGLESTAGAIHAVILSYSGGGEVDDVNPDVKLNQWNHVAFTVNATTGAFVLYCNGSLVASNTASIPFIPPQGLVNVNLGYRDVDSAELLGGTRFYGYLDEVSIYNRALSPDEIAAIYHSGRAGKCSGPVPPGITVPPANQSAVEGSNVALSVVVDGTGPFSYQWSFNGKNIFGATNATLTLTNLHPYQSGCYTVTITTPYGNVTSPCATVTVISQNILIYKYSGDEKITTAGQALSYNYSGQLFFIPDTTNGTFVGWATIKGEKQYWVNPLSGYLLVTIPGDNDRSFTVLGRAGQGIDTNGYPRLWSFLHKGQNSQLTIGAKKYFSFPDKFSCDATQVFPDLQTGNPVLGESASIYIFMAQSTRAANNNGRTMADLVNALTRSLAGQGYQKQ